MKKTILFLLLGTLSPLLASPIHFVLVNDCHAVMESWGYRDEITLDGCFGGYARAFHVIDSLRTLYPDMLFLHAGDIFTGDFLSTMTVGKGVWDLWMKASVEGFAIGNHEFEYGPGALDTVLGKIDVPLICANIDASGYPNLEASTAPYRIFSFPGDSMEDSVQIAVFGACTEEADNAGWTDPLDLGDAVTGIDTFGLPPEADAAIALTHLDYSDDYDVADLPFIDAVLGGHNHSVLDEVVWEVAGTDSTPIVKAGPLIIRVGHLTMDYDEINGLRFVDWDPIPVVEGTPESPEGRIALDAWRDTIIANPYVGIDPYETVAFVADSKIGSTPTGIPDSGWNDSPEGNLVTEAYRTILDTDIGVEGRGALRLSLWTGPVTIADLFRAAPAGRYPLKGLNSRLITISVTGQQLKTMLEYALLGAGFSAEVFPEFSGMRIEYDPSGSMLNRINTSTWTINGTPWISTDTYRVAGTEMLEYAMSLIGIPSEEIIHSDTTVWEALMAYCTDPAFLPVYSSDGRLKDITAGISELVDRPTSTELRAWPNPFNSNVKIESDKTIQAIEIFDLTGRLVKRISNVPVNEVPIVWSPNRFISTGVYLVRTTLADGMVSKTPVVYVK